MRALPWVAFVAGIVIVAISWRSIIYTLVVPRRSQTRYPFIIFRYLRKLLDVVVRRLDSYEARDGWLALAGPLGFLTFLVGWLVLFLVAFALMLLPFTHAGFGRAMLESGSSLFTLGIAARGAGGSIAIYFLAAATGLGVVALLIGYLPTLYGAFNRRETMVTTLQSRAGAPAWGPEILARHQLVSLMPALPDLYVDWEHWAADVAESHTNYPILIAFRSPHPLRSWVIGLLAVMDAAALHLALCPDSAPPQARLCLRMGFVCLREIADTVGISYDPDPDPGDPIRLTFEEYESGLERLAQTGFEMERAPEEAWEHFRGWRVNYEAIAYELADRVVAPPGPWTGSRTGFPDVALIPQRPVDRKPGDPKQDQPKSLRKEWRA